MEKILNNFSLPENHSILKINDINQFNLQDINEKDYKNNLKLEITLTTEEQVDILNNIGILDFEHLHISLICSNLMFKKIDLKFLINKSIMKNIKVKDTQIEFNFYLVKKTNEAIIKNNVKIIEAIEYSSNDIELKSMVHEILYHANTILKNYRKYLNQIDLLQTKMETVNNFVKKL